MRILIVEDEKNIADYVRKTFESEGFIVDVAYDGNTALDMALDQVYDAITLDIMLPGMNGYEVCKQIRAASINTPILMLTAKDGEFDEADALDIGADDFLRKPFSLVVLVARVRALIRRGGSSSGTLVTVGDLTLDSNSKVVQRAGQEIVLTPREFQLLEYLMNNPGQVLSKTQLMERIWGHGFAADENVIEVYIGYLRKKIDNPFDEPLIHTVRGRGYKIEASVK